MTTIDCFNLIVGREALLVRDGSHEGVYPESVPTIFKVDRYQLSQPQVSFIYMLEKAIKERFGVNDIVLCYDVGHESRKRALHYSSSSSEASTPTGEASAEEVPIGEDLQVVSLELAAKLSFGVEQSNGV